MDRVSLHRRAGLGFYAYELITVEAATRSAVYESGLGSIDNTGACTVVLNELSTLVYTSGKFGVVTIE